MKKIINGLRYDTDSAVKVGWASNSAPMSDFSWWEATLYRTPRSGRYFLAGEGGPMTTFSKACCGNLRGYGERVIPMSKIEAREWAEQNLTTEELEAAFASAIADA